MDPERRALLTTYIEQLKALSPNHNSYRRERELQDELRDMSRDINDRFVLGRLEEMERDLGDDALNIIDNIIYEDSSEAFEPQDINNLINLLQVYVFSRPLSAGRKKKYKRQTKHKKSKKKGRRKRGARTKTKNKK